MDENSDATVLMKDDDMLDTNSPCRETKQGNERKIVLDGGRKWITGAAVQDTIVHSINCNHAL